MHDDPRAIANYLVEQSGLDVARQVVFDGIIESHRIGDLYAVSVWREVRQALGKQKALP
jgi:hypothetical protein